MQAIRIVPFLVIIDFILFITLYASSINEVTGNTFNRNRIMVNNRTRLIVTIFDEPLIMLRKDRNSNLSEHNILSGTILDPSQVEGYYADLAYTIFDKKLKIPYKFIIEKKFGNQIEKGVWDGILGALVNRVADAAIASLTITAARAEVVDFSYPFINSGISLMMAKPQRQKLSVLAVLSPFAKEIWVCIFLSYVFVSLIWLLINRLLFNAWYRMNEDDSNQHKRLSTHQVPCFWFTGWMHQSGPRSMSGLVIIGVWWFFIFILFSWYIGRLAAFSVDLKLITPIQTIDELAKQTDIQYGVNYGGSTMAFFNRSKHKTIKTLWNFMQRNKDKSFASSTQDGIERVRRSKGKYALFLDSLTNEYINGRIPCNTMRVGETIAVKGYSIATPHGSDLREVVNIAVLELLDSGFLDELKQKWFYGRHECRPTLKNDSKYLTSLNLTDMAGIFYILIIGIALAVVIAVFEFLLKAKRDATRLSQTISQVIRHNLQIAIMGIDSSKKPEAQRMNSIPTQDEIRLSDSIND